MTDASPKLMHQGVLIKSPPESKSKDLGRWRKRYFRLWSSKTLEYYKSEKSKEILKKPIDLNKCKSIDGHLKNKKWNNIFCLNTEERRFFLVANSQEDMEQWILKICGVCGFSSDESKCEDKEQSSLDFPSGERRDNHENNQSPPDRSDMPLGNCQTTELPLPSYDEPLPCIPDSPEPQRFSSEFLPNDEASATQSIPYARHVKQNRQNIYTGSPGASYDTVPPPRPVGRRMSTPAETARLNQNIIGEAYVEMQPENSIYDAVPPPRLPDASGSKHLQSTGSYDLVPTPVPVNGSHSKVRQNGVTYDIVPPPLPVLGEYVPCDITPQQKEGAIANSEHETVPPVPDPTYTGFDTLPEVERSPQISSYSSSNDNIYSHPPILSESEHSTHDLPENYDENSIYDTPPLHDIHFKSSNNSVQYTGFENVQVVEDSSQNSLTYTSPQNDIYSSPPIKSRYENSVLGNSQQQNGNSIYDKVPQHNQHHQTSNDFMQPQWNDSESDSIYDRPPNQSYDADSTDQNLIYDIPPAQNSMYNHDSIYDSPPDIYDVPPSPAELFDFNMKLPAVDRTLKYASTGEIDMRKVFPPKVDRSDRPTLTASVPVFPKNVTYPCGNEPLYASDTIYDRPPTRHEIDQYAASSLELASPIKQPRETSQYIQFDFPSSNEHLQQRFNPSHTTNYSSVDMQLTEAVKNARISSHSEHYN